MAKRDFSKLTLTELIVEYAAAAEAYGHSMDGPDHKSTNREAKIIAGCYRELRKRGIESQKTLLQLLDGGNGDYVRCWVGAHALEFAPEIGEPVLTELAKRPSFVGFVARETLGRWREGALKFP